MIATGQLILGTDKRNALFTVYEWEEDDGEEQLHVYYGLELLEVVPADRNAPSFKMLVGRLYNAGLSRRVLQETFRVDLETIQRWAAALRNRDGEELVRVLAGRRAGRKLTPQIEAYVRARWADLSRSETYGIGKRLREEIESVFAVKLCQETLRPLIGQLKRQPCGRHPRNRASSDWVAKKSLGPSQQPQTVSSSLGKMLLKIKGLARKARRLLAVVVRHCKQRRRRCGVITLGCWSLRRACWPSRRCSIRRRHASHNGWPVCCWAR